MPTLPTLSIKHKSIALLALATSLVTLVFLTTNGVTIFAQEAEGEKIGLTAIPPRLGDQGELTLQPGEEKQVTLRISNNSDRTLEVTSIITDIIVDDDGSTPTPIDGTVSNRWALASWVTLVPAQHTIKPKETVQFNVVIEVPEDALPGGHYATIFHQPMLGTAAENLAGQSGSSISQKVGSILYVLVDGPINEEAFIRKLEFPKFTEYGPVPFIIEVENRSDIHIRPQLSVEIFNLFGNRVSTIQIGTKNIFPFANRTFDSSWDRVWGFGLYKAKLTMSYGSQGGVVVANTSFWLLPIKIVISILVGLIILILSLLSVRRHLKYRRQQEQKRAQLVQESLAQKTKAAGATGEATGTTDTQPSKPADTEKKPPTSSPEDPV